MRISYRVPGTGTEPYRVYSVPVPVLTFYVFQYGTGITGKTPVPAFPVFRYRYFQYRTGTVLIPSC
ncbi:hypothetical protein Hanom_Chr09g00784821 [Helianthus anomalus]